MPLVVQTVNCRDSSAGQQLVNSLHETGFAILTNHSLPGHLLDSIYSGWHRFFGSDEKQQFLFDPDDDDTNQGGFHPQHISETAVGSSTRDIKEFFHVVPDGPIPKTLKHEILEYRELALDLGRSLLGWVQYFAPDEISAKFSKPLPQVLSPTMSLLRVLHYPPLTGSEEAQAERAAAHEDINLLTLLPVADQPGLQVKGTDNKWIDVASNRGDLIVNTGDMLLEATAGYFPSTTHRVVNPQGESGNVSRLSIPFFLAPRMDFVLSDRYTAGGYLKERLRLISR